MRSVKRARIRIGDRRACGPRKSGRGTHAGVHPGSMLHGQQGYEQGVHVGGAKACYFGIVVVEKGRGKRGPKQLHVRRLILFWSPATIGPRRLLPVSCILSCDGPKTLEISSEELPSRPWF